MSFARPQAQDATSCDHFIVNDLVSLPCDNGTHAHGHGFRLRRALDGVLVVIFECFHFDHCCHFYRCQLDFNQACWPLSNPIFDWND